jgi:ribosome-associated protein
MAGRRWTADGAVVIQADSHRSQVRNREDALARLVELIQKASGVKRLRGRPEEDE